MLKKAKLDVSAALAGGARMNRTEAEYADELELRRAAGEVSWWAFEPITFRLADRTRYTPDFAVLLPDGKFELIEIKATWTGRGQHRAGWKDDSRAKFKVCRELYPFFTFRAFRKLPKREGLGFAEIP